MSRFFPTSTNCVSTPKEGDHSKMHALSDTSCNKRASRKSLFSLSLISALLLSLALALPAHAELEITDFSATLTDAGGNPLTQVQAGSHPDLVTDFKIRAVPDAGTGGMRPVEQLKDLDVDLPAGFYGNPTVAAQCQMSQFAAIGSQCPVDSQVGFAEVRVGPEEHLGFDGWLPAPIFNLPPQPGDAATFGFSVLSTPVTLSTVLRPDGDYGLRTSLRNANQGVALYGSRVTLWGVPADPIHNQQRWAAPEYFVGHPSGMPRLPLITAPTNCGTSNALTMRLRSWQDPTWVTMSEELPPVTGCDKLTFDPKIQVRPSTGQADTPSGYEVHVFVPQNEGLTTPATPTLRRAVVTLPEGVAVSPASAQGLEACSDEELALGTNVEPSCPNASRIGTVTIDTPLLPDPLEGEIVLGTPRAGHLFRLFIVARGDNVLLKLPGVVEPDPETGQLRAVFDETPQLPFSDLHLHFKGGSRAALVNPDTCGAKVTVSELTPWGAQPATPSSSFDVTGCSGAFSPSLHAGVQDPVAGASSPFRLQIAREDGEQKLSSIDLALPPGQLAKLRGVPYCPEAVLAGISSEEGSAAAEAASPSCPAASQVGTVLVGAGAGTTPLYVTGKAYLAGPYKGAPLSLAFVTPALAGPFDLGNVVVRSALKVDPVTTQVEAVSDPLPTILHGVPLDLKDVRVNLDRPDFTANPTSCKEMVVSGTVHSTTGTAAPVSNRYQLGDCAELGFKPGLSLKLTGPTHRSAHPALRAVLRARKGDANIGRAVVTLPKTEFLENAHIRTVCTRAQYAADNCPKGSIYGYAKAWSPLLDKPLQGPVYLRSSNHPLPDLVASLDGQIHIDLDDRIDSVHSRIRATFDSVPDAPVSKFVLNMQGGKKGLLVNNTELCKAKPRASVSFTGHNGKHSSSNPLVKTDCGKKNAR